METFWPGPLTLLLPRSSAVPDAVTAGRPLVGVRMPAHPVAMELIRRAGVPIAAPSANRFGHTSPTTAEHVLEDLDGRIDAVVDAGPTSFGLESTVLDPNPTPMIVYRPGAITLEQIQAVAGPAKYFEDTGALAVMPREAMPSPGVGLRHYAPKARLILVEPVASIGDFVGGCHRIVEEMRYATDMQAEELGWMLPSAMPEMHEKMFEPLAGSLVDPPGREFVQFDWGRWTHPEELAQRLFAGLRYLDALGCTVIFCPVPSGEGTAVAIRDRLRKAASKNPVED
jgi:L-threonylcarbamoyladenylate synthase